MRRIVLLLPLLMFESAWAGHQQNPLPLYTLDNTRFELFFSSEGVRFQGHLYQVTGRNQYRTVLEPEGLCPTEQPGRKVGEIRRRGDRYVWTWTEFVGCGARARTVWRKVRREFSLDETPLEQICTRTRYHFVHEEQTAELTDHCDGTVTLVVGADRALLSQRSDGRYHAKARVAGERSGWLRWTIRWDRAGHRMHFRGTSRMQTPTRQTLRFRDTWTQTGATVLD